MITIEVYQVTKQEDDSYAAALQFLDDGKKILTKTVVAVTKEEFKDKIRVHKTKIEKDNAAQQSSFTIVQTAIDELMAEVMAE